MSWFEGFEARRYRLRDTEIFARCGGRAGGPPLLLLHGFPQTHVMWHRVAQRLADHFFLVLPDLPGYGDSALPPGAPDHANYSKRAVAGELATLMAHLDERPYFVCGHDRGARVAHRLALDHPSRVRRLCLLDIAPTLDMYNATDMAFARAYYHWFHLTQPAPLPAWREALRWCDADTVGRVFAPARAPARNHDRRRRARLPACEAGWLGQRRSGPC